MLTQSVLAGILVPVGAPQVTARAEAAGQGMEVVMKQVEDALALNGASILSRVAIIIPTFNASKHWEDLDAGLKRQGISCHQILIVDSSSGDGTSTKAKDAGYSVLSIQPGDFNHGGTRQMAADFMSDSDFLVYLTQDAVLVDESAIERLVLPFTDEGVGATFGRQLPRLSAGPREAHARNFNYPDVSLVRDVSLKARLGFKTIFSSNSFAAYRKSALNSIGGFPENVIVSEETIVFARLTLAGWKTAYVADAKVRHSHNYSVGEEFQRYFDIGVLHSKEPWLLIEFGKVTGEGWRFVTSEIKALWPRYASMIPGTILRTFLKLVAYRLGRVSRRLGRWLPRRLSQQKQYWR